MFSFVSFWAGLTPPLSPSLQEATWFTCHPFQIRCGMQWRSQGGGGGWSSAPPAPPLELRNVVWGGTPAGFGAELLQGLGVEP